MIKFRTIIATSQILSISMSLVTLSMTAATYLYFQHEDYISYDKRLKRRTPGLNDPSFASIMACTLLYIIINAPRIYSNALILSVSPIMAIMMMIPEFLINLIICHKLALALNKNAVFPSGFITAAINYACPCYPVRKIGIINMWSTILIIIKLLLLYPIIYSKLFTLELDQKPNILQCWNVTELQMEKSTIHTDTYPHFKSNFTGDRFIPCNEVQNMKYALDQPLYFDLPRFCACDEGSTDVLFHYTIPMAILMLLYSILFGGLITLLIRRKKLSYVETKVTNCISFVKTSFDQIMQCHICCREKKSLNHKDDEDTIPMNDGIASDHVDSIEKEKILELAPTKNSISKSKIRYDEKDEFYFSRWWLELWFSFLLNVRTMFDFSQASAENSKKLIIYFLHDILICIK